jgi:hypothetical protein
MILGIEFKIMRYISKISGEEKLTPLQQLIVCGLPEIHQLLDLIFTR